MFMETYVQKLGVPKILGRTLVLFSSYGIGILFGRSDRQKSKHKHSQSRQAAAS